MHLSLYNREWWSDFSQVRVKCPSHSFRDTKFPCISGCCLKTVYWLFILKDMHIFILEAVHNLLIHKSDLCCILLCLSGDRKYGLGYWVYHTDNL